jgi:hypothetical protein
VVPITAGILSALMLGVFLSAICNILAVLNEIIQGTINVPLFSSQN